MAKCLRTLAALPENSGSVPNTPVVLSSSRGYDTLCWPLWVLHALDAHTFMPNTHTKLNLQKKITNSFSKSPLYI